jgi:hypothetical protein
MGVVPRSGGQGLLEKLVKCFTGLKDDWFMTVYAAMGVHGALVNFSMLFHKVCELC